MPRHVSFVLLAIALLGCGSSRESVHEARFQKRKHLNGWQLDLRARHEDAPQPARLKKMVPLAAPQAVLESAEEREPIASSGYAPAAMMAPHSKADQKPLRVDEELDPVPAEQQEEDENLMPRKKWNAVAVPAFISALGTIALGFGTNLWLLVGAIALTFILCAWSIARIRRKEQAGKGFTVAALIIGVLAALLTLMSIGRYGTEL